MSYYVICENGKIECHNMSVCKSIFEKVLNEVLFMQKTFSQFQLKQILSSSNPNAEIELHKDEFFDFIDDIVPCN